MATERATCRARVVPGCEKWTQPAMVDETWTFDPESDTYLCDSCLGRIEPYVPHDATLEDYEAAIRQLRTKDSGNGRNERETTADRR